MSFRIKDTQKIKRAPRTAGDFFRAAGVANAGPTADRIGFDPAHSPAKFQLNGFRQALAHGRFALYDETGTGKTLPAQALLLLNACLGNKSLAIMPPNLIEQFSESFKTTFVGVEGCFNIAAMPRGPAIRRATVEGWQRHGWPEILLMSYQMFLKTWRAIGAVGYDAVVADEAHALKNPGAKVSAAFGQFIGEAGQKYVLLMTGTPAHNELIDVYGLIKITSPKAYKSKRAFQAAHCRYMDVNGYRMLVGYMNQRLLSANLYENARRIRKEQVYDLTHPAISEIALQLAPAHLKRYRKLVRERMLEFEDGSLIDATQASGLRHAMLRMVTDPAGYGVRCANAVLDTCDALIDGIDLGNEKVILVANYKNSVKIIARHYKQYQPALAYGDSDSQRARRAFLEDPACRMLVMHPKSGGMGFNLQSVCRYMIFVEPCGVPGDFKQTMDRVHRPGQRRHVTIYVLKAMKTIAPHMTRAMLAKEKAIKRVARDKTSVMDQLLGQYKETQNELAKTA